MSFRRVSLALLIPLTLVVVVPIGSGTAQAAATAPTTYAGSTVPNSVSEPTRDKPQSKIWYAGGTWWAVMATSTDGQVRIHRLDADHKWRSTGVLVDSRVNSTADVLWTGDELLVASRLSDGIGVRVSRFAFNAQSGTWSLSAGPTTLGTGSVDSVTIAEDTVGRVWVAYLRNKRIYVQGTTSNSVGSWGSATEVSAATGQVYSADVASIVSFGDKVGVMWSDQVDQRFYFAVHNDAAPVSQWAVETAWSGAKVADNHISLRSIPGDDRVFAAVKTSKDNLGSSQTLLAGLVRSPTGGWTVDPFGTVGDGWTRPVLSLDTVNQTAYVFMSSATGGGRILYKTSPIASTLNFSNSASTFLSSGSLKINNSTTAKQPVTSGSGMVVLASTVHRYFHGELGIAGAPDQTQPSIPLGLSASNVTSNSVQLSWQASTDNAAVAGYEVYRNGGLVGSPTTPSFLNTGLAASTQYDYTVKAVDTSGNVSGLSDPLMVTTNAGTSGTIEFRGATSGDNGVGGTSLTLPVPAATMPGDVMVAGLAVRGQPTLTPPAGWDLVRLDPRGTTMEQAVYTKVAGGSEPSSYSWTIAASRVAVGAISTYSGVSTTDPVSASSGQVSDASIQITAPSVDVGVDGSTVVGVFGINRLTTMAPPDGMGERSEHSCIATAPYFASIEMADLAWAPAGPTGAQSATAGTSGINIGQLVVLRPLA